MEDWYLLQLRSSFTTLPTRDCELKVNDIVLIHDEKLPRNFWKYGRIMEVFPGRDGKIRSRVLKTGNGQIKRPVQLLYPLELSD